jgi:hypothetical protein
MLIPNVALLGEWGFGSFFKSGSDYVILISSL